MLRWHLAVSTMRSRQDLLINSPTLPDWFANPRSMISLPFCLVDATKQARARRLAERGEEDGSKNAPASDSADLYSRHTRLW
jgi:hypothetical protein